MKHRKTCISSRPSLKFSNLRKGVYLVYLTFYGIPKSWKSFGLPGPHINHTAMLKLYILGGCITGCLGPHAALTRRLDTSVLNSLSAFGSFFLSFLFSLSVFFPSGYSFFLTPSCQCLCLEIMVRNN